MRAPGFGRQPSRPDVGWGSAGMGSAAGGAVGGALTDAVWIFALVIALAAAALASRRFLLERSGGTIDCGLRRRTGNWRLGVLSYQRDELCWYRAFGVLLRPEQVFKRRELSVISRRPADLAESAALGADRLVVEVSSGSQARVELAITEEALTGFLAWLEASPPGSHLADIG